MGQILTTVINWMARLAFYTLEHCFPNPPANCNIHPRAAPREKRGVFLIAASTKAAGREGSSLLVVQPASRRDDIFVQLTTLAH